MPHFACVVGARPNFMKMAPLLQELDRRPGARATLIHTGQHYDQNLSDVFFEQLGMRRPDISLEVGSGRQGEQTARILERIEPVLERGGEAGVPFDRLIVVGDVNSTLAAALAAVKLNIPVAHVEAGLRSFDRTMPEEINRILTDAISDQLFISEPSGIENLRREGHPQEHLHLVGNVMIDTLLRLLPIARDRPVAREYELEPGKYFVVTLHRPSNVDSPERLGQLVDCLKRMSRRLPCAFPLHPRTESRLRAAGLLEELQNCPQIHMLPPLGYVEFLSLVADSGLAVTDSGGLQEETTVLGIPCLTIRPNTERPITIDVGTNQLVTGETSEMLSLLEQVLDGGFRKGSVPPLWDGRAAQRICEILC